VGGGCRVKGDEKSKGGQWGVRGDQGGKGVWGGRSRGLGWQGWVRTLVLEDQFARELTQAGAPPGWKPCGGTSALIFIV